MEENISQSFYCSCVNVLCFTNLNQLKQPKHRSGHAVYCFSKGTVRETDMLPFGVFIPKKYSGILNYFLNKGYQIIYIRINGNPMKIVDII